MAGVRTIPFGGVRWPAQAPRGNYKPRIDLAQAMIAQAGSSAPVAHPLQGIDRVAGGVVGALQMRKIEEEQEARRQALANTYEAAFNPMGPPEPGVVNDRQRMMAALLANDDTAPLAAQVRIAEVMRPPPKPDRIKDAAGHWREKNPVTGAWERITDAKVRDPHLRSPEAQAQAIERSAAGRSSVTNVMPTAEKAYDKKSGEMVAEDYRGGLKQSATDAANAADLLGNLATFRRLNEAVRTGRGAQALQFAKSLARTAGIDLEALGIANNVAEGEGLESLSTEMTLSLLQKLSGPISEKEGVWIKSAAPALVNSKEGNRIIMSVLEKRARRELAIGKMYREFNRKHNNDPSRKAIGEFQSRLGDFIESQPLITPELEALLNNREETRAGRTPPDKTRLTVIIGADRAEDIPDEELEQALRKLGG